MPSVRVRRIVKREVDVPGLGERIRTAREADPRPVTALSRAVGISRNYWYQLETESVMGGVSEETIRKIETVLGVDLGVTFE